MYSKRDLNNVIRKKVVIEEVTRIWAHEFQVMVRTCVVCARLINLGPVK